MQTAIIGAGPTGLFLGAALARRGHAVIIIDRDPGPESHGSWTRKGVMQFHHAHAFRRQAVEAVRREMPAAYDRMLAAGGEPISLTLPDGSESLSGLRIRRQTFERALRETAVETPGLAIVVGHVEEVTATAGHADGLLVSGAQLPADLVIDASGRSGRATRALREAPTAGGDCGIAYVDRQFQLNEGAEPGPLINPLAWQGNFDGYQVLIFVHERGIFSVLIIRGTDNRDLVELRSDTAFDAACRAIPGVDIWTEPERSRPITPTLAGGTLMNYYRSQRGPHGNLALPGLLFVGDSVCTTTPNFGRGIALSMLQATEALRLIDEHGSDHVRIGEEFDAWCSANMLPWVQDHAHMDESLRRRWAGQDIDVAGRIPSDLIMAASQVDPTIGKAITPYITMTGLPGCLDEVEPLARAVYAGGWRPPFSPGPTRRELVQVVGEAMKTA